MFLNLDKIQNWTTFEATKKKKKKVVQNVLLTIYFCEKEFSNV